MFSKLDHSLKTDMAKLHGDLGQIPTRVEDTENRLDTLEIKALKEQIRNLRMEQRNLFYKNRRSGKPQKK